MPFWPFKKAIQETLTPTELRDRAISLAGNPKALKKFCLAYKDQIEQNVEVMCKLPDGTSTEDRAIDAHVQRMIAVAQCLANECDAPAMMNRLTQPSGDNVFVELENWFGAMPERTRNLEYDELIMEAYQLLEKMKGFRGSEARLQEIYLHGRLGELYFHSGIPDKALKHYTIALDRCVEMNDVQGQIAYHQCLVQVHLYLADGEAIETLEKLRELLIENGVPTDDVDRQLKLQRAGVPLCRTVCVRDGRHLELDELKDVGEGKYDFIFERNRLSLGKATALTGRANDLATQGRQADALELYLEASEVDPFDPTPVYQSGMCLLEIGAFAKGREAFEEVERLAPGWFRCRSDRWIAEGLEQGTISPDQLMILRLLEDGGLDPKEGKKYAEAAVEKFPHFAPFHLALAKYSDDDESAIASLRRGLELVEEPDLESRLLCQLAGSLPKESEERKQLIDRAIGLKGSLVALASAKLMGLQ